MEDKAMTKVLASLAHICQEIQQLPETPRQEAVVLVEHIQHEVSLPLPHKQRVKALSQDWLTISNPVACL
jgi:hypothetical protein